MSSAAPKPQVRIALDSIRWQLIAFRVTCSFFVQAIFATGGHRFDPGHVHQLNSRSPDHLRCNFDCTILVQFWDSELSCLILSMPVRSCFTIQDLEGVSHTVELKAATLYEAVAQGLAPIR